MEDENPVKYMAEILLARILSPGISLKPYIAVDRLYSYAVKNKVDLLLLETYNRYGMLDDKHYRIYIERLEQRRKMIITATRITEALNDLGYNAATFKSFPPFPAVPNDVDVLILDDISPREFNSIVKTLIEEYNYSIFDKIPYAATLHDNREGPHRDPRFKDPYDIDLYYEVAANKLIYLDKRSLRRGTSLAYIEGYRVPTLKPEYELLVQCIHSIIPEQMYLLYHLLVASSYIRGIEGSFKELVEETRAGRDVELCLTITYELLTAISRGYVGGRAREFYSKGYYRVKSSELALIIGYRALKDPLFRYSLIDQIKALVKPDIFKHVLENIIERRRRETY